jgi:hypothetical protein
MIVITGGDAGAVRDVVNDAQRARTWMLGEVDLRGATSRLAAMRMRLLLMRVNGANVGRRCQYKPPKH